MWNMSFPQFLTRYLLQQILAASIASEDSCSSSSETWNLKLKQRFFFSRLKTKIQAYSNSLNKIRHNFKWSDKFESQRYLRHLPVGEKI